MRIESKNVGRGPRITWPKLASRNARRELCCATKTLRERVSDQSQHASNLPFSPLTPTLSPLRGEGVAQLVLELASEPSTRGEEIGDGRAGLAKRDK